MEIDLKPTWVGALVIYDMLIQVKNLEGFVGIRSSVAKAFACADALQAMEHTLTEEQKEILEKSLSKMK